MLRQLCAARQFLTAAAAGGDGQSRAAHHCVRLARPKQRRVHVRAGQLVDDHREAQVAAVVEKVLEEGGLARTQRARDHDGGRRSRSTRKVEELRLKRARQVERRVHVRGLVVVLVPRRQLPPEERHSGVLAHKVRVAPPERLLQSVHVVGEGAWARESEVWTAGDVAGEAHPPRRAGRWRRVCACRCAYAIERAAGDGGGRWYTTYVCCDVYYSAVTPQLGDTEWADG